MKLKVLIVTLALFIVFPKNGISQEINYKNLNFDEIYPNVTEKLLDGPLLSGEIKIAFNSLGNLYLLDVLQSKIIVYDSQLKEINSFGSNGRGPAEFERASDIYIDSNDIVYISDPYLMRISKFTKEGDFEGSFNVENQVIDMVVFNNLVCTHTGGAIPRDNQTVNCYDKDTGKLEKSLIESTNLLGAMLGIGNSTFNTIQKTKDGIVAIEHPLVGTVKVFDENLNLKTKFDLKNEIYELPKIPKNFDVLKDNPTDYIKSTIHGIHYFNDTLVFIFIESGTGNKFVDIYDINGTRLIKSVLNIQKRWPAYNDESGNLYSFSYTKDKEGINLKKYILNK